MTHYQLRPRCIAAVLGDNDVVLTPGVFWGERNFLSDALSLGILGEVIHAAAEGTDDHGNDAARSQFLAELAEARFLVLGPAASTEAGSVALVHATEPPTVRTCDDIDCWFVPFLSAASLDAVAAATESSWSRPVLLQGLDGAARFIGPFVTSSEDLQAMRLALSTSVDQPASAETIAAPMDDRGAFCVQRRADLHPLDVSDPAAYEGRMIFWASDHAAAWTVFSLASIG